MEQMKSFLLVILSLFVIFIAGCAPTITTEIEVTMDDVTPATDAMVQEVDESLSAMMTTMDYSFEGSLSDVTGGETVQGVNTGGTASGVAMAMFADDAYYLRATFENLPDPLGTDFYEGWIVRKGLRFDVISTGKAEKVDGVYVNLYSSQQDLTDHTFYVLTIEPDDGDPAPAGHVVEGTMVKKG